jgi:hypothetical protein
VVLGINAWDEEKSDVQQFVDENKLKHRILLQGRWLYEKYGRPGIPSLLWINCEGVVVDAELGFHGPESLHKRTRRLLQESG